MNADDPPTPDALTRRVDEAAAALAEAERQAEEAAAVMRNRLREALAGGVPPEDLFGRPWSRTVVYRLARAVGIPPRKPGPAPKKPQA